MRISYPQCSSNIALQDIYLSKSRIQNMRERKKSRNKSFKWYAQAYPSWLWSKDSLSRSTKIWLHILRDGICIATIANANLPPLRECKLLLANVKTNIPQLGPRLYINAKDRHECKGNLFAWLHNMTNAIAPMRLQCSFLGHYAKATPILWMQWEKSHIKPPFSAIGELSSAITKHHPALENHQLQS